VNFTALESRLPTIWRSRSASPRQLLLLGDHRETLAGRGDGALQVEVVDQQGELARLDLGKVEHVVEDGQQQAARLTDDVQPLALVQGELAHGHHLGHGQHPVQRSADLVAHIGQELRFQDIGGVGRVARLHQLLQGSPERLLALVELAEEMVEAVGEAAEQGVLRLDLDGFETAVGRHLVHGFREPLDRRDDLVRQTAGQEQGHADPGEEQGAGEGDELRQHGAQRRTPGDEHQIAGRSGAQPDRRVHHVGLAFPDRTGRPGIGRDDMALGVAQLGALYPGGLGERRDGGHRGMGIVRAHGVRRRAGGDLGKGDVAEVVLLGGHRPLLQHEGHAGGDQHHHGRDQRRARDARMEGRSGRRAGLTGQFGHALDPSTGQANSPILLTFRFRRRPEMTQRRPIVTQPTQPQPVREVVAVNEE
jgi:hypothetical protein